MKEKNVGRIIGHIISLIVIGEIDEAVEIIKKGNFQCYARRILEGAIAHPDMNDDIVVRFVDQYIKNETLLSYKKGGESCSVLLDFTKELVRYDPTPIFWKKSTEMMQLFVYNLLKRDKENKVKYLYSFRNSSEFLLSELAEKELGVSSPEEFNDPFDCLILSSIRQMEQRENFDEYIDSLDKQLFIDDLRKIRVRCFVGDDKNKTDTPAFLNTLMWAHYANSHKGVCIKYSVNEDSPLLCDKGMGYLSIGRLDPVIYSDVLVENKGKFDFEECFLYKNAVWKYEDEYRLVYYDSKKEDKHYNIPLADLGLRIEAIYFGLNCDKKYRSLVQKIMGENDVEYYNIERDNKYINKLRLAD